MSQIVVEFFFDIVGQSTPQVADVRLIELEILYVFETLFEARKNGELALERILPEEEIEHGRVILLILPVGVRH